MHEQDTRELAAQVGMLLSKDNIIATVLNSPDSWNRIVSFTRSAIKTKEEKEKEMRKKTDRLRNIAFEEGSSGTRRSPTEVIMKRSSGGC